MLIQNFFTTVNIIGALFYGVMALIYKRNRVFNLFFLLFLLDLTAFILLFSIPGQVIEQQLESSPLHIYLPFLFILILFPLLYMSVKKSIQKGLDIFDAIGLLLFLWAVTILSLKIVQNPEIPSWLERLLGSQADGKLLSSFESIYFFIYHSYFCVSGLFLLWNSKKDTGDEKERKVLRWILIYSLVILGASTAMEFLLPQLERLITALLITIIVYLFIIYLLMKHATLIQNARNKYQTTSIPQEDIEEILRRLDALLKKEKIYRQAGLTLSETAEIIKTNTHGLSLAINREYKINFNKLINTHRIEEALELLQSSSKTISEIAYAVGFNSLSSFNDTFKKQVGETPTAYRKKLPK